MKLKNITVIFFVMLISLCASAQEESYIVKLNIPVQTFSLEENPAPNYIEATYDELQEYLEMGVVEYYEPNLDLELLSAETSTGDAGWHLQKTNAAFTRQIEALGNEVRVGVVDSGADMKLLAGYCTVGEGWNATDNSNNVEDPTQHGTQVSLLIGSHTMGGAGQSIIIPLKCVHFSENKQQYVASVLDVSNAIRKAVDYYECDIINISLGVVQPDGTTAGLQTLEEAVNYAISKGAIIIAAVGNHASDDVAKDPLMYPAAFPNVIGVGAVDKNNVHASLSCKNESVFVTAPGKGIVLDAFPDAMDGTSLSAPQVSALAAVCKAINPEMTRENFEEILKTTSEDKGDTGRDDLYGYGIINYRAAVKQLFNGKPLFISPVTFADGIYADSASPVYSSKATMYNNSEEKLSFEIVYALYNKDNVLVKAMKRPIELQKDGFQTFSAPHPVGAQKYTVKYMAWSKGAMAPLEKASQKQE